MGDSLPNDEIVDLIGNVADIIPGVPETADRKFSSCGHWLNQYELLM